MSIWNLEVCFRTFSISYYYSVFIVFIIDKNCEIIDSALESQQFTAFLSKRALESQQFTELLFRICTVDIRICALYCKSLKIEYDTV